MEGSKDLSLALFDIPRTILNPVAWTYSKMSFLGEYGHLFRGHQRTPATRWKLSVRRNYTEFQRGEPPAGKLGRNLNLAVDERPVRD